jgi:hypothetical protein
MADIMLLIVATEAPVLVLSPVPRYPLRETFKHPLRIRAAARWLEAGS